MKPREFNAPIPELIHALRSVSKGGHFNAALFQCIDEARNIIVELHVKNDTQAVLHPGPGCDRKAYESAVAAIEEQVFKSTKAVGRWIIFSDVPIVGYFRYSDEFQILPPPDDAPKPEWSVDRPHPILLEFAFDRSSSEGINNFRIMKRAFELSSLLNLFLNVRVWARDFTLRKGWVVCDDDADKTKLCTLIYGYNIPKDKQYSDFTDIGLFELVRSINQSEYFAPNDSFDISGGLVVPSNLNELLDKAFQKDIYEKLLEVTHRFAVATKLWDVSETAAYLASVNTIESLLEPSRKKVCEKCEKPVEGPTKAFKDFLDRHVSKSHEKSVKEVKDNIYKTRGKFAHRGLLFGKDRHPYWSYFMAEMKDDDEGHILRCLVREAIIKWFMERF